VSDESKTVQRVRDVLAVAEMRGDNWTEHQALRDATRTATASAGRYRSPHNRLDAPLASPTAARPRVLSQPAGGGRFLFPRPTNSP
jgi:hypothetical protein